MRPAYLRRARNVEERPAYLRRARNVEELPPWLYPKGISTGQSEEALTVLPGPHAPGLSATTIRRLVSAWRDEHRRWLHRDPSGKRYVYVRAGGVYFAPRLEHDRQCILVLIGADASGRKELPAVDDGFRGSEQSRHEPRWSGYGMTTASSSGPSSPPVTARSASGRRRGRSGPRPGNSGVLI